MEYKKLELNNQEILVIKVLKEDKNVPTINYKGEIYMAVKDYCKKFWGIFPELLEFNSNTNTMSITTTQKVELTQLNIVQMLGNVSIEPDIIPSEDYEYNRTAFKINIKFYI